MLPYERYALLRNVKGEKDADVAKATEIFPSVFTDWKNGRSSPGPERLLKIAKHFNVSIEFILTGDNPQCQDGRIIERPLLNDLLEEAYNCTDDDITRCIQFLNRINLYRKEFEALNLAQQEDPKNGQGD